MKGGLDPVGDVAEFHLFHQKYFVADGRIMKVSSQVNLRNTVAGSWILLALASPGLGQDPVATPASGFAPAGFVRLPSFPKAGAEETTNQFVRPASSFTLIPLPSLMLPAPSGGIAEQEVPEASQQPAEPKQLTPNSATNKTVGSDAPLELLSLDGIKNLNRPVNPTEIFQRFDMSRVVKNPESVALLLKRPSDEAIPASLDARDYGLWTDSAILWDSPAFCHNPLYFEQVNLERYGIGYNRPVNAIVSGSRFFIDASLLPIRIVQTPHNSCACTLGYLRPGNCNPTYKSHP